MSAPTSRTVYLLHFDRPFGHSRHYLGSTDNLGRRIRQHGRVREIPAEGYVPFMARVAAEGIRFVVARLWKGDRREERRLKQQGSRARLCPICCGREPDPFPAMRLALGDMYDPRELAFLTVQRSCIREGVTV